jgi:hypothetical protein
LLDYGDVVYDICPDYLKNQIERVNKQGAWIVTGLTKSCSTELPYAELSMDERRKRASDDY